MSRSALKTPQRSGLRLERCSHLEPCSIMIRRLQKRMDLPDFIGRQTLAESRHLGTLAAIDHRFLELLVRQLGGKKVRAASAGAVMTYVAFGAIDVATRFDRVR